MYEIGAQSSLLHTQLASHLAQPNAPLDAK
jgi:hypothetical protein